MKDPFTEEQLRQLSENVSLAELLNKRGKVYKERKDELEAMTDGELIGEMAREPKLIRRPILVKGNDVIVGFKEKEFEALLD